MKLYNQYNYKHVPYPSPSLPKATVSSGGCGCCCSSSILSYFGNDAYPPEVLAPIFVDDNVRVNGGTSMYRAGDWICDKIDGVSYSVSKQSEDLQECLKNGGIAVANVSGDRTGYKGVFSNGGHYILVLGVESNGMLKIYDVADYNGKFDMSYRKDKVIEDGIFLYCTPAVLQEDCNGSSKYYLFKKKGMTVVNDTVKNMVNDGVIPESDQQYWSDVFSGLAVIDTTDTKQVFDNYHMVVNGDVPVLPKPTIPLTNFKYEIKRLKWFYKKYNRTYTYDAHVVTTPVTKFKLYYWNAPKKSPSFGNFFNGSFFAGFHTEKSKIPYLMPVANWAGICDASGLSKEVYDEMNVYNKFENGRLYCSAKYNSGNQFKTKKVSTFIVDNEEAYIEQCNEIQTSVDYAISGMPIIVNGQDVSLSKYVKPEGWYGNEAYATHHIFLGLTDNPDEIKIVGIRTNSYNCIETSEAYSLLRDLGITDAIKLDGGGSTILNVNNVQVFASSENRTVANLGGF